MKKSELDTVLDKFLESKEEILKGYSDEEKAELIDALREKKKSDIVKEIKEQYKEEVISEVNAEIEREATHQKIADLKSLMRDGFILAFLVGLAVNQITDIIGYYKGTVTIEKVGSTIIIALVLCGICLIVYFYNFLKSAMSLLKNFEKNTNKS